VSPHNVSRRAHPLSAVSLERLAILLHQGVKGGLDDVVLIEVESVDAGAFFLHD
jgi:hypothetical protein